MATDPWPGLLGHPGEACGYTHDEHVHDDEALVCLRAKGHPGPDNLPARDMHLASVGGEPVFFGDPLVTDSEVPQ